MGVLIYKIKLVGSKGSKQVNALFDSGASFSFIDKELASKLGMIDLLPVPREFETARKEDKIIVKGRVTLDFYIYGICLSDEFLVIDELSEEVIIGAKTMQAWRLKLDFENEEVIVDPKVTRLMLKVSKLVIPK